MLRVYWSKCRQNKRWGRIFLSESGAAIIENGATLIQVKLSLARADIGKIFMILIMLRRLIMLWGLRRMRCL